MHLGEIGRCRRDMVQSFVELGCRNRGNAIDVLKGGETGAGNERQISFPVFSVEWVILRHTA